MLPEPLFHNLSLMNHGIAIFEHALPTGKKESLVVKPGHSVYSFDFSFWAHNIAEPSPDQLKQPYIEALPLQACMVGIWHHGCII